jgi:hypothetical protein
MKSLCFRMILCIPAAWAQDGGSNIKPPVVAADLQIVQRAAEILDSEAKWNRKDNRTCRADAKTFSLYCALQKATDEVSGKFEHRGAVMQEARFVVDEITKNRDYDHRLMDYNNDKTTTFADIKRVIRLTRERIEARLKSEQNNGKK